MSLEKIVKEKSVVKRAADTAANGAEYIINFIPKKAGNYGEKRGGLVGKYIGLAAGYAATAVVASAIPYVGGAAMYAVLIGSPGLAAYKKFKGKEGKKPGV